MTEDALRLDKWLWAARFFKTRSLAQEAIELGRVRLDGQRVKPSKAVKVGEVYAIDRGDETFVVEVKILGKTRGPASVAQTLYEETLESQVKREALRERKRLQPEPAKTIEKGRPTKRNRRELDKWSQSFE